MAVPKSRRQESRFEAQHKHEKPLQSAFRKGIIMEAKIIFKDGTEMTAEKNGDCLILNQKKALPDDLSIVTVQAEDGTRECHNAQVLECASVDGRYWFAFAEESEQERTIQELREQNAMLTECVLEMSEIVYGGNL